MPVGFKPIAFVGRTVNTYHLNNNCYYVTVAALLDKSVEQVVRESELMQNITGSHTDIQKLFDGCGVEVRSREFANGEDLYRALLTLPAGVSVGLAYTRLGQGTGHMLVVQRDPGWNPFGAYPGLRCIDYQTSPTSVGNFPPEPNMDRAWIYYRP